MLLWLIGSAAVPICARVLVAAIDSIPTPPRQVTMEQFRALVEDQLVRERRVYRQSEARSGRAHMRQWARRNLEKLHEIREITKYRPHRIQEAIGIWNSMRGPRNQITLGSLPHVPGENLPVATPGTTT